MRSGVAFDVEVLYESPGAIDLEVKGPPTLVQRLLKESGGHRWQRVPPTERRGRVHTSTVTVAAIVIKNANTPRLDERDIVVETMRGSGPGGQHRNRTESAVRMRHIPTGIEVRIASGRSQHQNRALARQILESRVASWSAEVSNQSHAQARRTLAGSGERGDKIRTLRVRDDVVVDHRSGRRATLRAVMRGNLVELDG